MNWILAAYFSFFFGVLLSPVIWVIALWLVCVIDEHDKKRMHK